MEDLRETDRRASDAGASALSVIVVVGLVLALVGVGAGFVQERNLATRTQQQLDEVNASQASQAQQIAALSGQLSAAASQLKAQQARLTTDEKKLDLTTQALPPDLVALAARVTPSVVEVVCTTDTGGWTGTGFALALAPASGYRTTIVTAAHVVSDCVHAGELSLLQGTRSLPVHLRSTDTDADVAILDTTASLTPLKPSGAPVVGEFVMVVGNPLGLDTNVTQGNVSQVKDDKFLHSAPTSSGNSGGPVVDRFGHVVGIVDAVIVDPAANVENLNIALRLARLCQSLLSGSQCGALH